MVKRYFSMLVMLCTWSLLLAPVQAQPFSNIYVFGDSLSDRGNLAAVSAVPGQEFLDFLNHFPFDQGFANAASPTQAGRRAVEVLADALALPIVPSLHTVLLPQGLPSKGNNFAVAGAVASGLLSNGQPDQPVFFLDTQLAAFDLAVTSAMRPPDLANALYVIFIGGNDVRVARDALSLSLATQIIETAVANIDATVRHLAARGGRAFLVVNSPDIGAIPESRLLSQSPKKRSAALRATRLSSAFNAALDTALRKTRQQTRISIVAFDLFQVFRSIVKNGAGLGYDFTRNACVDNPLLPALPPLIPDCVAALDRFVFFDEVHPSNHVHRRVGQALYAMVPALPLQVQ